MNAHRFLIRFAPTVSYLTQAVSGSYNVPLNFTFHLLANTAFRYKSSDVTGVAFSPLPDAELKIQLYYKTQEIKRRKAKLKEIAQAIWDKKPNVNYTRITLDECKKLYEEHTGRVPSSWEAKQIYTYVPVILFNSFLETVLFV